MLKKTCDALVFSSYCFFKISFLLSFLCLSTFLFLKSRSVFHVKIKNIEPVGTLVNSIEEIQRRKLLNVQGKSLKTNEEAEILRFILRFSDEIPTSDARKLARLIREECENYDLDPFLILAIIQVESRFDPIAVSNKGAIGLMQVMPETAEFVAEKLGVSMNVEKSLYNPFTNVRLGIYYFSLLINRFESIDGALTAYNFGPNRFLTTKSLREKTPSYVKKVLNFKTVLENERVIAEES